MCQVTRYPSAYLLHTIKTKAIVRALTQFISIFGIPKIIRSNQGSNFTFRLFAQVLKQLHVKHVYCVLCSESGGIGKIPPDTKIFIVCLLHWVTVSLGGRLPWLLIAAQEGVQESTGLSPNDLVFGHKVNGPLERWVVARRAFSKPLLYKWFQV